MKKTELSEKHLLYIKKENTKNLIIWIMRFALLVAFLGIWEILALVGLIDTFLMSCPSRILKTLISLIKSGDLYMHISTTLYETFAGFLIATVCGSLIALGFWWSEYLRRILEPYVVVLNSLPKIALGPVIIIWFGAGTKAIIFMAVLITIIVTVITMENSFLSTDSGKILLMRSMGASKLQMLTKLVIPSSLPTFVSCLKINIGMAWIGSIMGEYLVSKQGIGYLIVYGGQVFKLDLVMAGTVILCILAGIMYGLIALTEKLLIRWKN